MTLKSRYSEADHPRDHRGRFIPKYAPPRTLREARSANDPRTPTASYGQINPNPRVRRHQRLTKQQAKKCRTQWERDKLEAELNWNDQSWYPPVKATPPKCATRMRDMPTLTAETAQDIDYLVEKLETLADTHKVRIKWQPPIDPTHGAASYHFDTNTIEMHPDIRNDALTYAYLLAHELGHVFDPVANSCAHHMTHGDRHTANRLVAESEVVAEAAAITLMRDNNVLVENEGVYLDRYNWIKMFGGWRKALEPMGTLGDRYRTIRSAMRGSSVGDSMKKRISQDISKREQRFNERRTQQQR